MRKKNSNFPIFLLFFILAQVFIITFLYFDISTKKDLYYSQIQQSFLNTYNSILSNKEEISRYVADYIGNDPELLLLISKLSINPSGQQIRDELHLKLRQKFTEFNDFKLSNLQIHSTTGISLLKLNDKNSYGEDLLWDRYSLTLIKEGQDSIFDLEINNRSVAYRYLSPVIFNGEHIANLEIEHSLRTICVALENSIFHNTTCLLNREIIEKKLVNIEEMGFQKSGLNSSYVSKMENHFLIRLESPNIIENFIHSYSYTTTLKDIGSKLAEGESFIVSFLARRELILSVFLPLYGIDGIRIGYIYAFLNGDILMSIYYDQLLTYLGFTFLTLILIVLVNIYQRKMTSISNELRENNSNLELEIDNHRYTTSILKESERRFRDVAKAAGEFIWEINDQFNYEFVTKKAQGVTGLNSNELIGHSIFEFIPLEEVERVRKVLTKSLQQGSNFSNLQHRVIHKDGSVYWQSDSGVALFDQNQKIVGMRGVSMNITAIKEAESKLVKKDMLLQVLSFSAQGFLSSERWHDSISEILRMLGIALNVSRVFLAKQQIDNKVEECLISHEWVDKNIKKRSSIHKKIIFNPAGEPFNSWLEKFRSDKIVIINDDMMKETDKKALDPLIVRSLIYIPIVPDKGWWGFIGIEDEKENRSWERVEVEILKTIIDSISAAINKEDARAELVKLSTAVEQSSSSIAIIDSSGNMEFVNRQYEELSGYTADELLGVKPNLLNPEFHDEAQFQEIKESLNKGKFWRGKYLNKTKQGNQYWESVSISPISNQHSEVESFILVMNDITEANQYMEQLKFRADFEEIINNVSTRFINIPTTEIDKTIEYALSVIGEFNAVDRSYLFMIKNKGAVMDNTHEWCSEGIEAQKVSLQNIPVELTPWWMGKMYENEVINLSSLDDLPLEAGAEKEILAEQDIQSLLVLPLNYRNKLIGFIGFDSVKDKKIWKKDAINLLKIIGEIFVNAIQRKVDEEKFNQLYQSLLTELDVASNVQNYLLPKWLNSEKDLILTQVYSPSSRVGGDLFDMIKLDENRYVIYIADISGHGVQAALIMMAVKSIINMVIENEKESLPEPYQIINRLNKILSREVFRDDNYMTILLCMVDSREGKLTYFNAGHPAMIQYDYLAGRGKITPEKGSIPVGWVEDIEYVKEDQNEVIFDRDLQFILYTDGIFECEDENNNQLGIDGIMNLINAPDFEPNCVTMPARIKDKLIKLGYDTTKDDFTIVSFESSKYSNEKSYRKFFDMASILHVSGEMGNVCSELVLDKYGDAKLAFSVEIVINEYLNNIISHGLRSKPDTTIGMQIELGDKISLKFWDRGNAWELPDKERVLQQYEAKDQNDESGRGLYIIYMNSESIELNRYYDLNETLITLATGERNAESKHNN